jgi:hypothetical protein
MKRERYLQAIETLYRERGTDDSRLPGWTSPAEILLYQQTGERVYLDSVYQLLKVILEDYQKIGVVQPKLRLTGFKIPYRIVLMARLCLGEGLLEDEEVALLKQFFTDLLLEAEYERGSMNRAFGFLAAIHPVLEWVPNHPRKKELLEIEQIVLGDLKKHYEADEDSYGYGALTMVNLITWLEESELEDLYRHPKIRQCFENILDMWSGIGRASVYGDWRPTEPAWGWYICALEKAATVYQDGRFKWMAGVIFENYQKTLQETPDWFHPHDLYGLTLAFQCADDSVVPVMPNSHSKLIYRNNGHVERAMLRAGWQAGDLLAMVSLASGNEHGHSDPLAINGLIGEGVILEDNGRAGVEPAFHNVLQVTDEIEDFPLPQTRVPDGQWQTLRASFDSQRNYGRFRPEASFPFDYTHQVGNDMPRAFAYDPKREWVFIIGLKVYDQAYTFDLGAVTLIGDRSQRVITDFQNQTWVGLSSVIDKGEGRSIGRFEVHKTVSDNPAKEASDWATTVYIGVKFSEPFSIAADGFHSFEMDYKFSGTTPEDTIHLLCMGEAGGYPRKWMFNELPHYPVQVKTFQDNLDFTHGVFDYTEKSLSGRTIHRSRSLFFTKHYKHNFLWVRDRVFVEDLDTYMAAPLWHVMHPVDLGDGWFEVRYEGRALIWLLPKPNSHIVTKAWKGLDAFQRDPYNSHVIYCGKVCDGGEEEWFETLIIPLGNGEDGKKVKEMVQLTSDKRVLMIGSERHDLM